MSNPSLHFNTSWSWSLPRSSIMLVTLLWDILRQSFCSQRNTYIILPPLIITCMHNNYLHNYTYHLRQCPAYRMIDNIFCTRLMLHCRCLQSIAMHMPMTALLRSWYAFFLLEHACKISRRVGACCLAAAKTKSQVKLASLEWSPRSTSLEHRFASSCCSRTPTFFTMWFLSSWILHTVVCYSKFAPSSNMLAKMFARGCKYVVPVLLVSNLHL